ncbi:MAG TPA: toll/interleukin-1 receptor domain-containing protein [Aggregatilineales bacterium]|nr:toll/interleukin-1 receptor domain-containing protein [Anaerolineales bacterium]HRE49231.1 toll/interleukin-1 receptor domain-containing protein [Aggregatilineales bacterium]
MRVFIAHAPGDNRSAHRLALDLMKRGLDVFVEAPDTTGELTPEQRREAMREGMHNADSIVVFVSPAALVSPEFREEVERVLASGKPLYCVSRQEVMLTKAFAELRKHPEFRIGLADYEDGVTGLLSVFGIDPTKIVKDILSEYDVDSWMPGKWFVKFYNPKHYMSGIAEYTFQPNRDAEAEIQISDLTGLWVHMHMHGNWSFSGDRLSVAGESKMAMFIQESPLPRQMPYVLSLKILELTRERFQGVSTAGDRVLFYRVAEDEQDGEEDGDL